jgi:short-subunit dehydrogenase
MNSSTENKPVRPLERHQTAIIVGASSGIGAALAHQLISHSYSVALVARRIEKLTELSDELNRDAPAGIVALPYPHDVTDYAKTPLLFQTITADLQGLDLIVYAAAVQPAMTPEEYDFEKNSAMVDVNLKGAIAWLDLAAERFERAGTGHLVGISSIAADRGRRLSPAYNASKAGMDTYLEGLRNRVSRSGVTVTTIRPGFVDTKLLENAARTFWVISADDAARQIYRSIQKKKQTVYLPKRWRYVGLVIKTLPSLIFRRLNI